MRVDIEDGVSGSFSNSIPVILIIGIIADIIFEVRKKKANK